MILRRREAAFDEEVDLAVAGADLDQIETTLHVHELRERLLGEVGQVTFRLEAALQQPHLVGNVDQQQAAGLEHGCEHIHGLAGIREVLEHMRDADQIEEAGKAPRRQVGVSIRVSSGSAASSATNCGSISVTQTLSAMARSSWPSEPSAVP